jgi:predicted RNA-binding protein YlqC (UPF0109 family)
MTDAADTAMPDLIEFVARALVDHPDEVEVEVEVEVDEVAGDETSVIELRVAPEDLGRVIGRQGRTARAMRTLLGALSQKQSRRAVLEIIE